MAATQRLVVIGNGMAGARTVEEILTRGGRDRFAITVFGDEPHGNYNRILLSGVLSGTHQPSDIFLNPVSWYRENGIDLRIPVRVTRIDREAKQVCGSDGCVTPYDTLLIATGSRPFLPPMDGLKAADGGEKHGVFVFRTIDDCRKIAGCATKCRRAAVIGGGLLGLEAARGLLKFGVDVHVIHAGPTLMNAQCDAASGRLLQQAMGRMGVHVHLNRRTQAILGDEEVTGLAFQDGSTLDCDMVVISAGIRPNAEIGRECGLSVERAIVTDDQMRSVTDPDVFVVGECAQHRNKVYGLVAPLWEQGAVIADVLTGKNPEAAYTGSKLATKLKVAGVSLASMGITEPETEDDEVVLYTETRRGIYQKLILRDDILVGAILLGDTEKAAFCTQAFDRAMPLDEDRRAILFDTSPKPATKDSVLLTMPDDAKVCNCLGLSKGDLRRCVENGNTTLEQVQSACRAGTGCGTCKPLVQEIITWVKDGHAQDGGADDVMVCTCNGVTTGQIQGCIASGIATMPGVMDATRAGTGCGGCKSEIQALLAAKPKAAPAAPPAASPFGKPEVEAALKVLMRELVQWAQTD